MGPQHADVRRDVRYEPDENPPNLAFRRRLHRADLRDDGVRPEALGPDQMALLSERSAGGLMEQGVSLRLLQHYASSVRHNQYHDTDVVTVRVESAQA